MEYLTIAGFVVLELITFVAGAVAVLFYMISRMVGSDGWDDSNITNALRLLSHAVLHPEDFVRMYYLTDEEIALLKENGHTLRNPFWYLPLDEISEVVKTRP